MIFFTDSELVGGFSVTQGPGRGQDQENQEPRYLKTSMRRFRASHRDRRSGFRRIKASVQGQDQTALNSLLLKVSVFIILRFIVSDFEFNELISVPAPYTLQPLGGSLTQLV